MAKLIYYVVCLDGALGDGDPKSLRQGRSSSSEPGDRRARRRAGGHGLERDPRRARTARAHRSTGGRAIMEKPQYRTRAGGCSRSTPPPMT